MTASLASVLTIEEFLKLPHLEESPAWEYVHGVITQKPMPKTRHSFLQKRPLTEIDRSSRTHTALPELRCTFQGRLIVPDVAVVAWERIPINELGEPADDFLEPPAWSIEILSPNQKANRVIDNLLFCLKHGSRLGWMIDPDDYSILIFAPQQEPQVCRGISQPLLLSGLDLAITVEEFFSWLQIRPRNQ